ncbi:lipoxygenase 3 [Prunus dulcis]|uniref:Lipoxygenase 3 n=1 Tax=Prunus dulcis TaxID=3755 RepID=A0A4Y1RX29_PRUDU|nr:lipoxygenase 3 [Prunus dulcis]
MAAQPSFGPGLVWPSGWPELVGPTPNSGLGCTLEDLFFFLPLPRAGLPRWSWPNKITFGGMFFVLAGIVVVGTVFFYFFLPETKGKTLEQMGALFE